MFYICIHESFCISALKNSHPIEVEVGHPSEVDEIFDNISYNKGASVIRMLHDFIGRDAFKTGMQHYLTTYSYKNTSTEDLWASLETASGKPVGKVMTTWTSQMGFPIVHVDSMTDGDGKTVLTLNQEKFNADGSASEAGYMWCIPIKILDDTGKVTEILMETKETIVTLENIKWFKLNPDFVGYYRVHYKNQKDLDALKKAIENKVLSEVDRLGLIDDTYALVQAGKATTDDALELIKACKNETSYVVWSCIIKCLGCLRTILAHDEDLDDKYKAFAISLMGNIVEQVGWNANAEESHVTSLLRAKVLSVMGNYGHPATVMEAKKRFADHYNDKAQIPADLRGAVYRTVAAHGGQDAYDQILDLFRRTDLHEEKDRLSRCLGASQDLDVLQKVLDFAMSDEIRFQDTPWVVSGVSHNLKGRQLAWQFLQSNYGQIQGRYKTGALLTRICKFATDCLTDKDQAHQVETFFQENFNPGERTIKQCVENILLNAKWFERDEQCIREFFNKQ